MPEQNLRIIVIGADKAHLEYEKFGTDSEGNQRAVRELVKELQATDRKLRREIRRLKAASSA